MDEDTRIVEQGEFRRTRLRDIYSEGMAEYSACNHLASNILGVSNLLVASAIASRFSAIALSFPARYRKRFRLPDRLIPNSEWATRGMAMRDAGDPGFLFAALLMQLSPSDASLSVDEMVRASLERAGLPSESDLRAAVVESMRNQLDHLADAGSLRQSLGALIEAGIADFESWPTFTPPGSSLALLTHGPCPPISWADQSLTLPLGVAHSRWDIDSCEPWFQFASDIENRMSDFSVICGV
jgi:hypothetical protein